MGKKSVSERFWTKVDIQSPDDCWNWAACSDKDGYGIIRISGKNMSAHRVAWMLHHKQRIPNGLWVLHTCDNPSCVNPNHLFLGDQWDNSRDCCLKERQGTTIRRLYATGRFSQEDLGTVFGVSRAGMSMIVNRKLYRHVD